MENNVIALVVIVIILSVLLIGAIIGIIVVAVHPYTARFSFRQYTATLVSFSYNGDATSGKHGYAEAVEKVFGSYKILNEQYDGNKVIFRAYTDKAGIIGNCRDLDNHKSCFVRTIGSSFGYAVPYLADYAGDGVCTKLGAIDFGKRTLKNCSVYAYGGYQYSIHYIVESETKYPVLTRIVYYESTGASISETHFKTFEPGKPDGESNVAPFSGVTVYDFRDGYGDAGKRESNVYKATAESKSLFSYVGEFFSRKQTEFQQFISILNEKDDDNSYGINIKKKQAIMDFLHISPSSHIGMPTKMVRSAELKKRDAIPKSFDSRTYFSNCKSIIGNISDQGSCGSCWAMSAAAVASDRYCIKNPIGKVLFSSQHSVYCSMSNNGCQGGQLDAVWKDLTTVGLVPDKCIPFIGHNGKCPVSCDDGTLITDLMKVKPKGFTRPWASTAKARVEAIQTEIMKNGPVQLAYYVFSDFSPFFKKSPKGIYHRSEKATLSGGHAVRIIGWGTEDGEDYWLVANSWANDWADGGVFRIRRGNNECDIEEDVIAGVF